MHASELVTNIGSSKVHSRAQAREGTLTNKEIEHASLDIGEQENKPFACEIVHASIKLEMSCTVHNTHTTVCMTNKTADCSSISLVVYAIVCNIL